MNRSLCQNNKKLTCKYTCTLYMYIDVKDKQSNLKIHIHDFVQFFNKNSGFEIDKSVIVAQSNCY